MVPQSSSDAGEQRADFEFDKFSVPVVSQADSWAQLQEPSLTTVNFTIRH